MTEKNTDRLSDLSTMREILSRHGFTFSKALGQNFLINPSVCPVWQRCAALIRKAVHWKSDRESVC